MIITHGTMFGKPVNFVCDGNCRKAFGRDLRPRVQWSRDPDDVTWIADHEIPFDAPEDPGTTEGYESKPMGTPMSHNKWCTRACERCSTHDGSNDDRAAHDWSKRLDNRDGRSTDTDPQYRAASEVRRWSEAHADKGSCSFVRDLRMFLTNEQIERVLHIVDGTCLECFDGPRDCCCSRDD